MNNRCRRDGGINLAYIPTHEEVEAARRQQTIHEEQRAQERAKLDERLCRLLDTIAHNPAAVRQALGCCCEDNDYDDPPY